MSNTLIRATLEARLKTWAQAQNVPVAWENVGFTKPASSMFVEPFFVPAVTFNTDVAGARATYIGFFQVNCWAPTGTDMIAVTNLTDSLIDAFPMLPKVGAISIESTPSAKKPIEDEAGWVIVPVLIKYRYEASIS